jgi:hypothetical protein
MRLAILNDVALRRMVLNNSNSPPRVVDYHNGGFSTTAWNARRAFSTYPNNPRGGRWHRQCC